MMGEVRKEEELNLISYSMFSGCINQRYIHCIDNDKHSDQQHETTLLQIKLVLVKIYSVMNQALFGQKFPNRIHVFSDHRHPP